MNEQVYYAHDLQEALMVLSAPGDSVPLAGCTDVSVSDSQRRPGLVWVYIGGLKELCGIVQENDILRIGAAVPLSVLESSPEVRYFCPLLAKAISTMASPQVRNRGTLGGNIVNASPAADALCALIALDAEVTIATLKDGKIKTENLPVREFITGPKRTLLKKGSLLQEIRIGKQSGPCCYEKLGNRNAMAIAVVSAAIQVNGPKLTVAVGSCGPMPVYAQTDSSILADAGKRQAFVTDIVQKTAPIDDIRATAEYRKTVVKRLIAYDLEHIAEELQ